MRVVIGLVSLAPGGTEYQMYLLANGLSLRGHDVIVYLTSSDPTCLMGKRDFRVRVSSISPQATSKLTNLTRMPDLMSLCIQWRKWLKTDKPDAIVCGLILPHQILCLASLGLDIPIIARRGFSWPQILQYPNYKRAYKKFRLIRPLLRHRTDMLVCNAEHVLHSAVEYEYWPVNKTSIICNGWPKYEPISHKSLRAVYSGLNRIEKDFSIPGVERISTIPVWSDIGIYVHPTTADGCSNSIGLAMAHAIPVIARYSKGAEELLGRGYSAVYSSEAGLKGWLEFLLSSHSMRIQLGLQCLHRARTCYSLEAMVDKWESLLEMYDEKKPYRQRTTQYKNTASRQYAGSTA